MPETTEAIPLTTIENGMSFSSTSKPWWKPSDRMSRNISVYKKFSTGSVILLSPEVHEDATGFNHRFLEWFQEDKVIKATGGIRFQAPGGL